MREEERKIIEETRRERERQIMIEKRIVGRCLTELGLGSISTTQIEDWLKLQGVSNPVVDRLANNVRASL
ncbi:MAG: hypothetical protein HFJ58_03330 [Clostridia bacterium]|nr:hypothetical protein [Clostridia bacterium]